MISSISDLLIPIRLLHVVSLGIACSYSACVVAQQSDQQDFPYTMIIAEETADVLSGPGKSHYATDRLPKGTKVLVYRHDPGGYYAVRPPQGSFSLVLASAVKPTTDPKIIEVQSSSAKAWVGSRLQGDFKPMWQLKLKAGELLNVVKRVDIPGAYSNDSEAWYQVEPPRGEFRWIHKDSLGVQAPASISTAEIANQKIKKSGAEVDLMQQLSDVRERADIASSGRGGWKVLENGVQPATAISRNNISANEAVFDSTRPPLEPPSSFNEGLQAIDLALSQMILAPKNQWNLSSLRNATDQLRKQATTGQELAQANHVAQKILDFQKLKLREEKEGTGSTAAANLQKPTNLSNYSNTLGGGSPSLTQVRYDGEGVLRKLYTNGGIGPAIYALEDSQGKVIKTITPAGGVNLERFVGKSVGLFGRKGFNQRLNRPHLMAQRVVDLNKIR